MTRHPFNPGELGDDDAALTALGDELERSATTAAQPSVGFAQRVLAAIDAEPTPRRHWYAALGIGAMAPALRGAVLSAVAVAAIAVAIVAGGLIGPARHAPGSDGSQTPTATPSASATPTPSPTTSPPATPPASPTFDPGTPEPRQTVAATDPAAATDSAEPSSDHGGSGSGSPSDSGSGSGSGSSDSPSGR